MTRKTLALRKYIYNSFIGVSNYFTSPKTLPSVFNGDGIVYILTPPHCEYIAFILRENFILLNIKPFVINKEPKYGFLPCLHVVICPQVFDTLPTRYIAFQLEQSVHKRWFTREYFNLLDRATHIFDYSKKNIEFLIENGFPKNKLCHFPIGHVDGFKKKFISTEKNIDVLFYGDPANPRRSLFLESLNKNFGVKIVTGIYGDAIHKLIARSKIVVNIHYYENALLETTRIYECLSLGALVVSENATDQNEHNELTDMVDFVDIGDVNAMIEKVNYWIKNENERNLKISRNNEILCNLSNKFTSNFKAVFNSLT